MQDLQNERDARRRIMQGTSNNFVAGASVHTAGFGGGQGTLNRLQEDSQS